jgi:hypothetical protein
MLYRKILKPKVLKAMNERLKILGSRIKLIDLIFTLKAKIKGFVKKYCFSRLFINHLMMIDDPRKDILLLYLNEGINNNYIQSLKNNLDLYMEDRSVKLPCDDLSMSSVLNKSVLRNVHSYKWWEKKEMNKSMEEENGTKLALLTDDPYRGIWDYIKRFTSVIKEEEQKTSSNEKSPEDNKLNCEKCLNGWKNENLIQTIENNISAYKIIKPMNVSDCSSINIIQKKTGHLNLALSNINEFSLIGNKEDDEDNRFRYSLRRSHEHSNEMRRKYGVNNVLNKMENEKRKNKDSHIKSILNTLSEPEKLEAEKVEKKKAKFSTSVSKLSYPRLSHNRFHENNIGLRDDNVKEELI